MAKHEITIHENTGATVVTATGCTSMATQPRGQTTEIIGNRPPRSSPAASPPSPG